LKEIESGEEGDYVAHPLNGGGGYTSGSDDDDDLRFVSSLSYMFVYYKNFSAPKGYYIYQYAVAYLSFY
jgi:hypothetical protein